MLSGWARRYLPRPPVESSDILLHLDLAAMSLNGETEVASQSDGSQSDDSQSGVSQSSALDNLV